MGTSSSAGSQRIVVGVDASDGSHQAMLWALDEAALRGAEVEAVHAWAPPVPASETLAMVEIDPAPYEEAAAAELRQAIDAALAERPDAAVPVEPHLVRGQPAEALVERAADADLLVIGSRGRGGFIGLLLGSVSQQCLHHATCPVVVIRAQDDR